MRRRKFYPSDTPFSDLSETVITIPESITSLPGYGWSAGDVYNYLDFEDGTYTQVVNRVDMSTLTWTKAEDSNIYTATINFAMKYSYNLFCAPYVMAKTHEISELAEREIAVTGTSDAITVSFYDSAHTIPDFLSGLNLYYEMESATVTDVHEQLPSNLIRVCKGASVYFTNANGSEYLVPVPSTIVTQAKVSSSS